MTILETKIWLTDLAEEGALGVFMRTREETADPILQD
jgi:hypothetical protein